MIKKKVFLFGMLFVFLINNVISLGISPAIKEYNFEPGFETSIDYSVFKDDPDLGLEVYVEGDLAEYVELSEKKLNRKNSFTATLKLPGYIEKPGKHRIYIGAREKVDSELISGTIGTSVAIQSVIVVNVAYPGKYVEASLKSHNVNLGEPINFELEIINKGVEKIEISPRIDILSKNKTIESLFFDDREIQSQQNIKLKKTLDTSNYNAGVYDAVAIIDYGKIAKAESEFRIGELVIRVVNYTKQFIIGGLESFAIEIESGWNEEIEGAYAEVFILDNLTNLVSFKTSTTNLIAWERKTIHGFFDTSNFTKGIYDANITLFYYGKNIGKSSSGLFEIEFIEEINMLLVWAILGIVLVIIGVILLRRYLKNENKKKEISFLLLFFFLFLV